MYSQGTKGLALLRNFKQSQTCILQVECLPNKTFTKFIFVCLEQYQLSYFQIILTEYFLRHIHNRDRNFQTYFKTFRTIHAKHIYDCQIWFLEENSFHNSGVLLYFLHPANGGTGLCYWSSFGLPMMRCLEGPYWHVRALCHGKSKSWITGSLWTAF